MRPEQIIDPNFTHIGLVHIIELNVNPHDQPEPQLSDLWKCDRCKAIVEQFDKRAHLEWHLGVGS